VGASLAGAAGLAAVGTAVGATTAQAADGDPLLLGLPNDAGSGTTLTVGAADGSSEAALALTNNNGPSLHLNPLPDGWNGNLDPGQIANTASGPLIGITQGQTNITTPLLTEQDVWLPFILPTPMRLLDTRTEQGRARITVPSPLDAAGRLPAGQSLTFWIAPAGQGFGIPAIHLNFTVVNPAAAGYAVAYPGPEVPDTSTVNYVKGQTVANGALIGTSVGTFTVITDPSQPPETVEAYVISVRTTAAGWIVVDSTGAYATGFLPTQAAAAAHRRMAGRTSPATRAQRAFGKL